MSLGYSYKDARRGVVPLHGNVKPRPVHKKAREWKLFHTSYSRRKDHCCGQFETLIQAQHELDHHVRKAPRRLQNIARSSYWIQGPDGFDSREG